ncbi:hypothetical protein GCM10017771_61050 [Streptomyces capitiformicae]|uniref:alcohol dehydrogenase n=2 Tax=Streptomyces capitiformicae TaxID=2014920 RepID=A0A918Z8T4_9ACTN|nr:alcohol dehydrogenase catalytic domain-containing protein [Streptomyces capitiformicae]GHE41688.1 hypothetical protein GCM10017771_61050 [Streptomyces capitiformicae]
MQVEARAIRQPDGPFLQESLELEDPRTDEVLVELRATGVCHTDLGARDQSIPAALPVVRGHEGAGVVRAVGSGVTGLAPGDHVVMSHVYCGACVNCRAGQVSYCKDVVPRTLFGLWGGRDEPIERFSS